jgi:hypothetical protein
MMNVESLFTAITDQSFLQARKGPASERVMFGAEAAAN